jgi:hypothetical protein
MLMDSSAALDAHTTDDGKFPSGRALLELGHDGTSLFTSQKFMESAGVR